MAGPTRTQVEQDGRKTVAVARPGLSAAVGLADDDCRDASRVGAKAAALARARVRGLPVLDGFAITTSATETILSSTRVPGSIARDLASHWEAISERGARRIVVRSSSVAEDGAASSMAGMFTSVTDVRDWDGFLDAVVEVLESSRRSGRAVAPIGVLVQPFLDAEVGGVMFGIDPVTGRDDRLVIAAAEGTPEALVSGEVEGSRYVLTRAGRVVEATSGSAGAVLGGRRRRALVGLSEQARRAFGGHQDVEWAIDAGGRLWMLQSRPVTATGRASVGTGPLLGPGPVAETFPDELANLEEELWLDPLRDALRHALTLTRAASRKRIAASEIVASVEGRAAVDLELLKAAPIKRSWLRKLDPRPPARRLAAGWDVGRLRAAMPVLASRLVDSVDDELARMHPLSESTDDGLVDLLRRCRQTLLALYGHEVLAGMLIEGGGTAATASSTALRSLARGRKDGLDDTALVARHPEVLALVPPRIGPPARLPETAPALEGVEGAGDPLARQRERCRLRSRWVQELSARAAHELGRRAARQGWLQDAADIRLLNLGEIEQMIATRKFPTALDARAPRNESPPLPALFRLAEDGTVVAEQASSAGGAGAGGGRAKGRVVFDAARAGAGDVLVVSTLDPNLAAVLPSLSAIVAETGSVLSHLAILAREFGVPAVVGFAGATGRFEEGALVVVDGTSGDVHAVEERSEPQR